MPPPLELDVVLLLELVVLLLELVVLLLLELELDVVELPELVDEVAPVVPVFDELQAATRTAIAAGTHKIELDHFMLISPCLVAPSCPRGSRTASARARRR